MVERRGLKRTRGIGAQVWREVELKIREDWSPEQVAGHRRRCRKSPVSHEWIYQHIWRDKRAGGTLWHHLRQRGRRGRRDRKYGRRGLIAGRIGIENRPAHIEARTRIGDWEVDTVFGAGHEGVLVSLTERKTRLEVLARVADKSAPAVRFGIVSALSALPRRTHSITSDNGKEFAAHRHIARALNAQFFFAHPYAAWERGTNENANGLLRQYFPRTRNFATITEQELAHAMERLNNRPRKILGFRTPSELFFGRKGGALHS